MPRAYQVQDKYFQMAKDRGYRARSAFKLLEVQEKFHILKHGNTVVDLGAAPGSFMQVIEEIVGPQGKVIGFDLQEIDGFEAKNISTYVTDIFEMEEVLKHVPGKVDVVTSDIAPNTSGIKDLDTGRSFDLAEQAFFIACEILKPGGHFMTKIFQGEDFPKLIHQAKKRFKNVSAYKPNACRDRSYETYIVAKGFKPDKLDS